MIPEILPRLPEDGGVDTNIKVPIPFLVNVSTLPRSSPALCWPCISSFHSGQALSSAQNLSYLTTSWRHFPHNFRNSKAHLTTVLFFFPAGKTKTRKYFCFAYDYLTNYHFRKKWHPWQVSLHWYSRNFIAGWKTTHWRNRNLGLKVNFQFERSMICDHVWWGRPNNIKVRRIKHTWCNGNSVPGKKWNRKGRGSTT